jgi:hypothetical protein
MGWVFNRIGHWIARYLETPAAGYEPFTPSEPDALRDSLRPGDVLLVEGNNHIAGVIKYLTQSTWSHSALFVGPVDGAKTEEGEPHVLIEANIGEGVVSAPLSKYYPHHTRICRPIGLTAGDLDRVCVYAVERIGFDYDLKNIIDLLRFLLPLPLPQRWRRSMISLGSGDPTRMICSALIALRGRALSDPPQDHPDREQGRASAPFGNSPFLALHPARLRYLALFRGGEADAGERLQLQEDALGRPAIAGGRDQRSPAGGRTRRRHPGPRE